MLIAGPISGVLSDRYGARPFASGGMIGAAISFGLLMMLPIDFSYPAFAAILALNGISMGMFASPNRAGVMNSLPAEDRGAGGGMNQTFQNSAQVVSIGVFFTLMIIGLSSTLPAAISSGLEAHGVSGPIAQHAAHLPPVSILFAAFLGYNPIAHLLGAHALASMHASTPGDPHGQVLLPASDLRPRSRTGCARRSCSRSSPACSRPRRRCSRGGQYHHATETVQADPGAADQCPMTAPPCS